MCLSLKLPTIKTTTSGVYDDIYTNSHDVTTEKIGVGDLQQYYLDKLNMQGKWAIPNQQHKWHTFICLLCIYEVS